MANTRTQTDISHQYYNFLFNCPTDRVPTLLLTKIFQDFFRTAGPPKRFFHDSVVAQSAMLNYNYRQTAVTYSVRTV